MEREFEAYLACGDPAHGFAWLTCGGCATHRLVPFSCKKRGFCPACCGRRMVVTAAKWEDEVIPRVAVRQWVLTVPWERRRLLARKPALMLDVVGIALRIIDRWYAKAVHRPDGAGGAVVAIQRAGSALNLNPKFGKRK